MCSRRAIVKDVELFKDMYATAILDRPGKQVVGCVLTAEMSDDTVVGQSFWREIKEEAVDFEKNDTI